MITVRSKTTLLVLSSLILLMGLVGVIAGLLATVALAQWVESMPSYMNMHPVEIACYGTLCLAPVAIGGIALIGGMSIIAEMKVRRPRFYER